MTGLPEFRTQFEECKREFLRAKNRYFFLDHDGTLVPFDPDPRNAAPSSELLGALSALGRNPRNEVFVVSGRPQEPLDEWFQGSPVGLAAEHGLFLKCAQASAWEPLAEFSGSFLEEVAPLFRKVTDRNPTSTLEVKRGGLTWHFVHVDPRMALAGANELIGKGSERIRNNPFAMFRGKNVIEMRVAGVDKGTFVTHVLRNSGPKPWIFCAGDDRTDEDMFAALPSEAWTCRVGTGETRARFRLNDPEEVHRVLREFAPLDASSQAA